MYSLTEDATDEGAGWNCSLFVATRAWNKDEITWNRAQVGVSWADSFPGHLVPFVHGGGDYNSSLVSTAVLPADSSWITIDVTSAISSFIQNPDQNFGFVLKDKDTQKGYFYTSSKYSDPTQRPKLTLSYETSAIIPVENSSIKGMKIEAVSGAVKMTFPHSGQYSAKLHDAKGRLVVSVSGRGETAQLSGISDHCGMLFLTCQFDGNTYTRSLIQTR